MLAVATSYTLHTLLCAIRMHAKPRNEEKSRAGQGAGGRAAGFADNYEYSDEKVGPKAGSYLCGPFLLFCSWQASSI